MASWKTVASTAAALVVVAIATTVTAPSASAAGRLRLDPSSVDFGDVELGDSEARDVAVTNDSDGDVTVTSSTTTADEFAVVDDACAGATLEPGASCVLRIEFTPDEPGERDATVQVTAAGPDGEESAIGTLEGRGQTPSSTTVPTPTTAPVTTTTPPRPEPTVPTTVVPPTTTTIDERARLDECERQAKTAFVSFEPDRRMSLGETSRVRVFATLARPPDTTDSSATTVVEPAALRCEVEAQLRGADFDIVPEEFQVGSFFDQPEIEWVWDVVPRRAGDLTLTIQIRSSANVDGKVVRAAGSELFESRIRVVAPGESVDGMVRRWTEAVVDHPIVRGAASLLAIAGAVAALSRRSTTRPAPGPSGIEPVTAPPTSTAGTARPAHPWWRRRSHRRARAATPRSSPAAERGTPCSAGTPQGGARAAPGSPAAAPPRRSR